nr:MAG TPA: hypothetical protein [Caudoviricetes sp.]
MKCYGESFKGTLKYRVGLEPTNISKPTYLNRSRSSYKS